MAAATFSGRPRSQVILPINLDGGDGTDGAFSSSASGNYSAITGVAADGNSVYVGNFTTFTLNNAHTLTLDQRVNILLATGAVTLGGGTSGAILGTGNGGNRGVSGDYNDCVGGDGAGAGNGGGQDGGAGGGGGGAAADGTNGGNASNPYGQGGKQTSWLEYFLTGSTAAIPEGGGGGAGKTQHNVNSGANGGNGGATLYVVSRVSITLKAGFTWTSNGNNGSNGSGTAGGGGGGAAGSCVLCAPIITIDATTGTVIELLGGSGGTGGQAGGAGSVGHSVLLYSRYYSVGGTVMSSTNLAARTNPDANTYAFAPYEMTGFGRRLRATVPT